MEPSSVSPSWATSTPATSTASPPPFVAPSADEKPVVATSEVFDVEARRALALTLDDPLNRYYRYPAARALLKIAGGLPFTPDQVTIAHTFLGFVGATMVALGSHAWLVAAAIVLEVRMILDCYDGVLARAKGTSSPRGRTLDELGDGASYLALCIGMAVHVGRTHPEFEIPFVAAFGFVVLAMGAFSGHAYDFYKRRLGSALNAGRDAIGDELRSKQDIVARGQDTFLTRFGIWFDRWQVRLYEPPYANDDPVGTILTRANEPSLRFFVRAVGILSWDNVLAILHVGLVFGLVFQFELVALGYGAIMLTSCRILVHRTLSVRK